MPDELIELRGATGIGPVASWHPEDVATSSWIGAAQIGGLQMVTVDRGSAFRRVDAEFIAFALNTAIAIAQLAIDQAARIAELEAQ